MGRTALPLIPLASLGLIAACAHRPADASDDLVVFGYVESRDYVPLDEWGISGQITGRLSITRIISGRPPASVLRIRYIAHMNYASDREVRFHLRRSNDGDWLACSDDKGEGYVCR